MSEILRLLSWSDTLENNGIILAREKVRKVSLYLMIVVATFCLPLKPRKSEIYCMRLCNDDKGEMHSMKYLMNMQCQAGVSLCEIEDASKDWINKLCSANLLKGHFNLFALMLVGTLAWGLFQNSWSIQGNEKIEKMIEIYRERSERKMAKKDILGLFENPNNAANIPQGTQNEIIEILELDKYYYWQNIANLVIILILGILCFYFRLYSVVRDFDYWELCDSENLPTFEEVDIPLAKVRKVVCFDPDSNIYWYSLCAWGSLFVVQALIFLWVVLKTHFFGSKFVVEALKGFDIKLYNKSAVTSMIKVGNHSTLYIERAQLNSSN